MNMIVGLHYKLKQNDISSKCLNTLTYFLDNTTQRVILNGQYLSLAKTEAEVSEGSILWPLLFLIYTNNLCENLVSNFKLFAEDASRFSVVNNIDAPD